MEIVVMVWAVGASCAKAVPLRGSAHEIVLSHAEEYCAATRIRAGVYDGLFDAGIDVIPPASTGNQEEQRNRADPLGRLRLLTDNARTRKRGSVLAKERNLVWALMRRKIRLKGSP